MWFRRKKKSDADTALTDTLMSLESLLDEKKSHATSTATTLPEPETPTGTDNTLDFVKPDGLEDSSIKNAVASDEHLEWDFKVDLASDDAPGKASGRAFLKAVESDDFPDLEVPEFGGVIPIRREQKRKTGEEPGAPRSGAADDIPILSNIVNLVEPDLTTQAQAEEKESETPFEDQCLKDIRKRLKRKELTPLTEKQENHLRAVLTSLKLQKTCGKFE